MSDTTFRPPIPEKSPPATAEDDPWFEEASDGETHPMNPAARALVGDTPAPLVTWLVEEDRAVAEGALRIGLPADARFSMAPSQWWWLRPRSRRADGSRRINCIDVTARRAAEASGRRGAIDRVLSALDDLSDAFVIYDNSGHLIVCNRRFRDLYGYSEEEARPGVHFRQLGQIDIERGNVQVPPGMDPSTYLDRKAQYRRELKGTFQVRLKDGRWLETRDRRTADGGFVSIQADITDRRRAEDALVQAKERAEQALKDVAEAHAQLEQFAYVASHDLREPLRMVTAYLDLLERRCAKMLDDDGREFIAHARGGAKRMDALILDLLAYTRVGRCDQADTTVDMAALLAAVRANPGFGRARNRRGNYLPHGPSISHWQ